MPENTKTFSPQFRWAKHSPLPNVGARLIGRLRPGLRQYSLAAKQPAGLRSWGSQALAVPIGKTRYDWQHRGIPGANCFYELFYRFAREQPGGYKLSSLYGNHPRDIWTFRGLGREARLWRARAFRFGRFNLICVTGIILSVFLLKLHVSSFGMSVYPANFSAIVAVSIWNCLLNLKFGWACSHGSAPPSPDVSDFNPARAMGQNTILSNLSGGTAHACPAPKAAELR